MPSNAFVSTGSTLSYSFGYLVVCYFSSKYKLMKKSTVHFGVSNNFCSNILNSADPDQRAPTGAFRSGSTMVKHYQCTIDRSSVERVKTQSLTEGLYSQTLLRIKLLKAQAKCEALVQINQS